MSGIDKFLHDGAEFEIRTEITDDYCEVKVFLNGKLVGPTYSVKFETHADYFSKYQESLIKKLKSIAKSDIEQEIYFR